MRERESTHIPENGDLDLGRQPRVEGKVADEPVLSQSSLDDVIVQQLVHRQGVAGERCLRRARQLCEVDCPLHASSI